MVYRPVRIRPHPSDPDKQENYTVICHSHRIRTIVTAKPSVVRKWVKRTRNYYLYQLGIPRLVVGLGVQWTPGGRSDAATLQLCVGHNCLIFQLQHATRSPAVLRRFLSDLDVIFVGFWNYRDADLLEESRHRLIVSHLVDVRDVASDLRGCRRRASMEELALEVLGMSGVKKEELVGRSEWDDRWLREDQVQYACLDVFISFFMAKTLRVWEWVED